MPASWSRALVTMFLFSTVVACTPTENELILPDAEEAAAWFGEGTEARVTGNVLEIRGRMDDEFLRRGGSLWERSGPYFYLFTVHVQQIIQDHPDLAAVRAITTDGAGREVARATLHRSDLNVYEWREALGRAALAQRQGTDRPRLVEELILFGQERIEYEYGR